MPPRFCSRCGTKAFTGAKFCAECGASLAGGPAPGAAAGWRWTGSGAATLGFFLIGGLTMWTLILSPEPPRPMPGATSPAAARNAAARSPAAAPGQLPPDHPGVTELPAEVKTFIADLADKAKASPESVDAWLKLARVDARAAQIDASYSPQAVIAFRHVLDLEPKNAEALRGLANVHYDRNEPKEAIPLFERYLEQKSDDASARTDLGTMYLSTGDIPRAIGVYREVLRANPSFLQAHYNLALAHHRQGDAAAALKELGTARGLATDEAVRKQIDEVIASVRNGSPAGGPAAAPAPTAPASPFQAAVEGAFRAHPIMGPRIVRFDWSAPTAGRVVVQNFPMEGMPPAVREKFAARLGQQLRDAQQAHAVTTPIRVEIADVASGTVMATVSP